MNNGFLFILMFFVTLSVAWRSNFYPATWRPGNPDLLQDFSYAGYHHTGANDLPLIIPESEQATTFNVTEFGADPTGVANSTDAIQNAINRACPSANGRRIVYLPPGIYRVSRPGHPFVLSIHCPNLVLKGAGKSSTFLFNDEYNMRGSSVIFAGVPNWNWLHSVWNYPEPPNGRTIAKLISDAPIGSIELKLSLASGVESFAVNDWIVLQMDLTQEWLDKNDANGLGWNKTIPGLSIFYRRVVHASPAITLGNDSYQNITIDVPTRYPLYVTYNARATRHYEPITEVGVEDFSMGNRMNPQDEWSENSYLVRHSPAYNASGSNLIYFKGVSHGWIRNISTYRPACNHPNVYHLLSNAITLEQSSHVTIKEIRISHTQFPTGGGNGYGVTISAQENLVQDVYTYKMRHGFSFKHVWSSGNVVFVHKDVFPWFPCDFHMFLSVSNLIDSPLFVSSGIYATFRPDEYPVHGYTTSHTVLWNVVGSRTKSHSLVDSHQLGVGYVIGTQCHGSNCSVVSPPSVSVSGIQTMAYKGRVYDTTPCDFLEGENQASTLEPQSLYLDQLSMRLSDVYPTPLPTLPTPTPSPTPSPFPSPTPLAQVSPSPVPPPQQAQSGTKSITAASTLGGVLLLFSIVGIAIYRRRQGGCRGPSAAAAHERLEEEESAGGQIENGQEMRPMEMVYLEDSESLQEDQNKGEEEEANSRVEVQQSGDEDSTQVEM